MTGAHRVRLAAAVLAAASLTGCSGQVSGNPSPVSAAAIDTADVPDYATDLSDETQELLAGHARIRNIDPCGLVDDSRLDELGIVNVLDARNSDRYCTINIRVDRDAEKSLEATVSISPNTIRRAEGADTVTVDGADILEDTDDTGGPTCYNLIPFTDDTVVTVQMMRRSGDAPCLEANVVSASILPRLGSFPLRRDSNTHAYHAVSVADPCAAYPLLVDDYPGLEIDTIGTTDPWQCQLTGDDARHGNIRYSWTPTSIFDNTFGTAEVIQIDGHPTIRTDLSSTCRIEIAVGDPDDGVTYDRIGDSDSHLTNTVSVYSDTCAVAQDFATAALAAFLDPL